MHEVKILWGSEEARKENEPIEYEFDTELELLAFLHGVDEASGWLDYEIIDEAGMEVKIVPASCTALDAKLDGEVCMPLDSQELRDALSDIEWAESRPDGFALFAEEEFQGNLVATYPTEEKIERMHETQLSPSVKKES